MMWRMLLLGTLLLVLLLVACESGSVASQVKALSVVGEPLVTRADRTTIFVAGRVKNEAQKPYTGIVTVTLFDAGGKIVGTATGAANSVAPGDEVTYQASGLVGDTVTWTRVEAKVTTQFPG